MKGELWTGLGAALLALLAAIIGWPKTRAAARKLNAEAGHVEWQTLRDEINRLDERVAVQDKRIAELEKLDADRASREAGLKRENKQLRTKVGRLERRIADLEEIFNITRVTPEQQALLDKIKDAK